MDSFLTNRRALLASAAALAALGANARIGFSEPIRMVIPVIREANIHVN